MELRSVIPTEPVDSLCESTGEWRDLLSAEAPRRIARGIRAASLFPLLENSPDEVGNQGEQHDQESGNPDEESGGELWGLDFFFVHTSGYAFGRWPIQARFWLVWDSSRRPAAVAFSWRLLRRDLYACFRAGSLHWAWGQSSSSIGP